MQLEKLADDSILSSANSFPLTDTYTIVVHTTMPPITGFQLETLEHPTIANNNGPGHAWSGNFILAQFEVDAEPLGTAVPGPLALFAGVGLVLPMLMRVRKQSH